MKAEEFIRRLKTLIHDNEDSKFVFFLGAGCSVSSGIPAAARLVNQWLPRLKEMKTGSEDGFKSWIKDVYPDYTEENASSFYGKVIEDLFLLPEERQREIERLTEGKDPGFGYAVLAQLMVSHYQIQVNEYKTKKGANQIHTKVKYLWESIESVKNLLSLRY